MELFTVLPHHGCPDRPHPSAPRSAAAIAPSVPTAREPQHTRFVSSVTSARTPCSRQRSVTSPGSRVGTMSPSAHSGGDASRVVTRHSREITPRRSGPSSTTYSRAGTGDVTTYDSSDRRGLAISCRSGRAELNSTPYPLLDAKNGEVPSSVCP